MGFCLAQINYAQSTLAGQAVSYSADGAPIKELILELESKYQLKFSYASSSIEDVPIHADIDDMEIEKALSKLFANTDLEYKIIDGIILLRKSEEYELEPESVAYQSGLHLQGKVASSETPLEYASISVSNTSLGTFTDEEGNFDIEIPSDYLEEDLIIHFLGFEDAVYNIKESTDEFLLVSMTESPFVIEEVEIVNKPKPIRIDKINNALVLNPSSSNASGLVGNDVSKAVQNLSGVSADNDASADILIRGSNSDETLIVLDGIPIYEPSHYYGIFSAINPNYIDDISLYKNNLPIEYGGKTAGLVEMHSSQDIPDKVSGIVDINLLNASMNMAIPFSNKVALMLSGRTTYTDVSNTKFNTFADEQPELIMVQNFSDETLLSASDPSFSFQDINAKLLFKPSDKSKISLNFYNTNDDFIDSYDIQRVMNNNSIEYSYTKDDEWRNQGASFLFDQKLSQNTTLNAKLYYSSYQSRSLLNAELTTRFNRENEFGFSMRLINDLEELGAGMSITQSIFKNQKLTLGASYKSYELRYNFGVDRQNRINNIDRSILLNPYAELDLVLSKNWSLKAGVRGNYFSLPEDFKISPRLQLIYDASESLSFKSAFSINHQFVRELNFEFQNQDINFWVASNGRRIPSLSSQNAMLGFTQRLGMLTLDVEFYNKDMDGVLAYILTNPDQPIERINNRQYQIFKGVGYSRGVDILLSTAYKSYDSYLSYTYSKTFHSFNQINNGEYFPAEIDRRHQFKWINEYSYGAFSFGANLIYSSGKPYRDFVRISREPLKPITKNLPAYQRMDLSANYVLSFDNVKSSIGVSLFNALNNDNVKYIQSINTLPERDNMDKTNHIVIGNETNLLSRTLNLNLTLEF